MLSDKKATPSTIFEFLLWLDLGLNLGLSDHWWTYICMYLYIHMNSVCMCACVHRHPCTHIFWGVAWIFILLITPPSLSPISLHTHILTNVLPCIHIHVCFIKGIGWVWCAWECQWHYSLCEYIFASVCVCVCVCVCVSLGSVKCRFKFIYEVFLLFGAICHQWSILVLFKSPLFHS